MCRDETILRRRSTLTVVWYKPCSYYRYDRENPVTLTSDAPNDTICDGATATLTANVENVKPFKLPGMMQTLQPILLLRTKRPTSILRWIRSFWVKVTDSINRLLHSLGPLTITVNTQPVLSQDSLTLWRCYGYYSDYSTRQNRFGAASVTNGTLGTVTLDNNSLIISTLYFSR